MNDPRLEEAKRLYVPGVVGYERVARRLGVSPSTVIRWLNPDYAERSRKRSLEAKRRRTGVCEVCGGVTRYNGHGENGASRICASCQIEFQRSEEYKLSRQKWTRERILLAIKEWAEIHGEPPAAPDWGPFVARNLLHDEERALRFERANGRWPWFTIVFSRFGSWNAAIEAAGFSPRLSGGGGGNNKRRRDAKP